MNLGAKLQKISEKFASFTEKLQLCSAFLEKPPRGRVLNALETIKVTFIIK